MVDRLEGASVGDTLGFSVGCGTGGCVGVGAGPSGFPPLPPPETGGIGGMQRGRTQPPSLSFPPLLPPPPPAGPSTGAGKKMGWIVGEEMGTLVGATTGIGVT